MKVGFTGTRKGMTPDQRLALQKLLAGLYLSAPMTDDSEFHHGDCLGADAEAHDIAEESGFEPVIHPPANAGLRAFKDAERVLAPEPYLQRNAAIVKASDVLVAAPDGEVEQLRSGTWATVREARSNGRQIYLVFPNGSVRREG